MRQCADMGISKSAADLCAPSGGSESATKTISCVNIDDSPMFTSWEETPHVIHHP